MAATDAGLPPADVPGAIDRRVTQANIDHTICVAGYTASVRPPESYTEGIKRKELSGQHLAGSLSDYELDHRVPLEAGGDPTSLANLWMEPHAGLHGSQAKDAIENAVKHDICDGTLTLAQGQAVFLGDWWTAQLP